jgi:hypothetical protein
LLGSLGYIWEGLPIKFGMEPLQSAFDLNSYDKEPNQFLMLPFET